MKTEEAERLAYTVTEAARMIGFSSSTLYKYAAEGQLVFYKRGNKTFVSREELLRFIKSSPTVVPKFHR